MSQHLDRFLQIANLVKTAAPDAAPKTYLDPVYVEKLASVIEHISANPTLLEAEQAPAVVLDKVAAKAALREALLGKDKTAAAVVVPEPEVVVEDEPDAVDRIKAVLSEKVAERQVRDVKEEGLIKDIFDRINGLREKAASDNPFAAVAPAEPEAKPAKKNEKGKCSCSDGECDPECPKHGDDAKEEKPEAEEPTAEENDEKPEGKPAAKPAGKFPAFLQAGKKASSDPVESIKTASTKLSMAERLDRVASGKSDKTVESVNKSGVKTAGSQGKSVADMLRNDFLGRNHTEVK